MGRNQQTQHFEAAKGCFVCDSQVVNVTGQTIFLLLAISSPSQYPRVNISTVVQCEVALCTLYITLPF